MRRIWNAECGMQNGIETRTIRRAISLVWTWRSCNPNSEIRTQPERGQVAVIGLLFLLIFVFIAAALIDTYTVFEARDWGYQVAQQAALSGVSVGRDWSGATNPPGGSCTGPNPITLDAASARSAAIRLVDLAMGNRSLPTYTHDVRVLPDYDGGFVSGYPPSPVRLGSGLGNWSADEPAIGVYLTFPVSMFLLSLVGRPTVIVHVFASASVGQPIGVCPP